MSEENDESVSDHDGAREEINSNKLIIISTN
jgi:hypothetical protein